MVAKWLAMAATWRRRIRAETKIEKIQRVMTRAGEHRALPAQLQLLKKHSVEAAAGVCLAARRDLLVVRDEGEGVELGDVRTDTSQVFRIALAAILTACESG